MCKALVSRGFNVKAIFQFENSAIVSKGLVSRGFSVKAIFQLENYLWNLCCADKPDCLYELIKSLIRTVLYYPVDDQTVKCFPGRLTFWYNSHHSSH